MSRFVAGHHIALGGLALVVFVTACSDSPTAPSAPVVHDTLNAAGGRSNMEFYQSERSGPTDRQLYDDFVSSTAATIRTVAWQGGYSPSTPVATSFFLAFIADNGGFPRMEADVNNPGRSNALYSATYAASQVSERLDAVLPCTNSNQQCGLYNDSVTLMRPFTVVAGTRYWLLIQADVPFGAPGSWGWRRGTPDNQRGGTNIAGTTLSFDLAFSLR